ncbi:MAG: UvrD-helicase domain-containing protein [Oscillospiraceae bacterium]|nr:UvrD-helicase domain-containing protein [Oscillospiraceae bacterium]
MQTEHSAPTLNDKQQQAVDHVDGPLLILAGAGSGKTTVLIERVANMIERGVKPWQILAITFTNKAGGEIRERLEKRVGEQAADVWAHTFHSACVRILRRDIDRVGFTRSFSIYDADDSQRVLKAIMNEHNIDPNDCPPRAVLTEISKAKDQLLAPEQYAQLHDETAFEQTIAKLYKHYQKALRDANALDFDDILCHAVNLLLTNEDLLDYYRAKFRYIMIDEYQDTNHVQYLLASALADEHRNFCVVGDDDQSIYRFRGATVENILNFQEQYPDALVVRLEENYRSTGTILRAANGLIAKNSQRLGKTLWTSQGDGEKIAWHCVDNSDYEASTVCNLIMKAVGEGAKLREFAVLYRVNAQANKIEESLRRNAIPYRIVGGTRFFDRLEIRDMLAYLHVINNPQDTLRLLRIVNTPSRKIGQTSIDTAQALALQNGITLYEVLAKAYAYPELSRVQNAMINFTTMLGDLRDSELPLDELYDALLQKTKYCEFWEAKDDPKDKERANNARELKSSITAYIERCAEQGETPALSGFLEEVALFTDLETYDENSDAVVLMTVHSAKGLEFDRVMLVGLEENIFPSPRSVYEQVQLEEERRLCYVAVTRARKILHLFSAQSRMLYGQTTFNQPSRFISEIPQDCVTVHENRQTQPTIRDVYSPSRPTRSAIPAAKPSTPLPDFQPGMRVTHTAFGNGMVISARPMGGDCLLEIEFDDKGKKRLMAKSAMAYLSVGG